MGATVTPRRFLPTSQSFRALLRVPAALIACALLLAVAPAQTVHADSISDLEQQIQADQAELASVSAQQAALRGQIADAQDRATQLQAMLDRLQDQLRRVNAQLSADQKTLQDLIATEHRLEADLAQTQANLAQREKTFGAAIRAYARVEHEGFLSYLLSSKDFGDLLSRFLSWRDVSGYVHRQAVALEHQRDTITSDKNQITAARLKQTKLVADMTKERDLLTDEYGVQTEAEQELFALEAQLGSRNQQLQGRATTLQQQITSDQTEIQNLLAFSEGPAGSGGSIVEPEYLSNSWGTYYNQRDARWGNDYVGPSGYQVWEIGCLLSDVAMMYTHFGLSYMTPGAMAAHREWFSSGGEMYNQALNVPGHPANVNWSPTTSWIDSQLLSGGAVIVGMYVGGGTHFVTLVGLNGPGDYWMNDPWEQDAMHVSFDSSPVTGPIYEAIAYR